MKPFRVGAFVGAFCALQAFVHAQIPFAALPSWISADSGTYATGVAWADLNNDGWLDLVVANGNDMRRQRVAVYYNNGSGALPLEPDWESADIDYHGHLAICDVNKDGFVDVAVSVYIGPRGFADKGRAKLYYNQHGQLESLPSWVSADSMYTFSCAFGDADGDGFPDLAVACGEPYSRKAENNRIYYNRRGKLDSLPTWRSRNPGFSLDVSWADFDDDGDLDLAFANQREPNQIFSNYKDSVGTIPSWVSQDASQFANSLFCSDVNNDGYLDLAVSDNNQLGGTGNFKVYLNAYGTVSGLPYWTSAFSGTGSGITFADFNGDGYQDMLTGGWWQPCRIYMNGHGTFTAEPQWVSNTSSVVEAIVCGDLDNSGLDTITFRFVGDGTRALYRLSRSPLQRLLRVTWNGDPDSVREYCFDLENGWISFAGPAGIGTEISVTALLSHSLDLAVTNWDPQVGDYVFQNQSPTGVREPLSELPAGPILEQNFPNPFNPVTNIQFSIVNRQFAVLKVFDILGEEIATLVEGSLPAGTYSRRFDGAGLPTGVYFYRLETLHSAVTRKMVVAR